MAFNKTPRNGSDSRESGPVRVLSPERLESRARNVVLHQLNRSIKSRFQLQTLLQKREIPEDIATKVLDRFEEAGLIDDARFAEAIVSSRRTGKGLSKSAIVRELRTKGVSEEVIATATEHLDSEQDLSVAVRLVEKRYRSLEALSREVRNRRLLGFLQRKGFSGGQAFAAIKQVESQAVKSEF